MRIVFSVYFMISVLLLLCFFFFGFKLTALSYLLLIIAAYLCKHYQDNIENETTHTKTHDVCYTGGLKTSLGLENLTFNSTSADKLLQNQWRASPGDLSLNSFFYTPSIMWHHQSFSKESPRQSPIAKPTVRMKLNTTMPLLTTSPMSTRQRKSYISENVAAAGPLLSSPFIPQIKRALGLEPRTQSRNSSLSRRHSLSVPPSVTTSPAGAVPHVRLNRSRRTSLSDRNTSMLNRSSTVKIAPPTPGKISSPSLYQMRNDVTVTDDRSTPDTYAVVNALKERRKRSITSHEETSDLPVHHAKRRRQESQQSNASTSSLPGPPMPDNLPDLSNASFARRMETPSLKRPSRPSQDTPGEWDREREVPAKRCRGDIRNNSILSSLSSSRRFAEKQELQLSLSVKRKMERCLTEKENENIQNKLQKTDTVILEKEDRLADLIKKKPELPQSKDETVRLTNGHADTQSEKSDNLLASAKSEPTVPKLLKKMTSLKKSATVYSGLAAKSSFSKAHFANVVATAADYDSDRETEQNRVKQILQDLDDSFSQKEAKSAGLTTDSATTAVSLATISVPAISTATSAVTIATTTVTMATSSQPSVLSTLTSLSQSVKSPVQESGTAEQSTAVPKSEESTTSVPVTSSTGTSGASSPKFKPLFEPLTSAAATAASSSGSKPTGFTFGLNTTASSSSTIPVISQAPASSSSLVAAPLSSFGSITGVSFSSGAPTTASTLLAAPTTGAPLSATGNFSFGLNQTKSETINQPTVSSSMMPNIAPAPAGFGIALSTQSAAVSTAGSAFSATGQTALSSNFTFGASAATTTTSASAGGFSFGQISTTSANSAGGFGFGQTSTASANSAGGLSFGQTGPNQLGSSGPSFGQPSASTSSAGGFTFGQTPSVTTSATGFGFGQGALASTATTTASAGLTFGQTASTAASGFSFGQTSTTTAASAGGFSFASGLSATKPSAATNLFPSALTSTSTAGTGLTFGASGAGGTPAFGNPASTQPSTGFAFGSSTGGSTPAFGFGANPAATSTAPSQTFQFGTNTATSTGFSFGSTTSTAQSTPFGAQASSTPAFGATTTTVSAFGAPATAAPAFGAAASSTPAFGAPTGSSVFAFGAGSSGTGTTATPFQTSTPATSAGGFSFGQNSGSAAPSFAFGATSTAPTAFGGSNTSAPAFSSNPQSGSVFGGVTGGAVKSNTPVFGTSHSQSNTPTFGTSSNPAPAFGPKSLTPTFGSSANNNAGFSFGQQAAPNVNPFGQTTPAKQTGSAFGQTGLESTPQQQTGSMFQFGQSGTQQASTAVKGFDFSASAGAASGGGFNFSAGGTPGSFGTPSLTPTGTPTPGFTMGSVPRPPRVMSKARRRTTRK